MPNVTEMQMDLAGKITFELDNGTTKIVDLANLGAAQGTPVVDNLTSTSTTDALSANQGRILDGKITTNSTKIGNVVVSGTPTTGQVLQAGSSTTASWQNTSGGTVIVNDLTTGGTTSALSAQQGVTLKTLVDSKVRSVPGGTLGATYTALPADDSKIFLTPVSCAVTVNTGLVSGYGLAFSGAGAVTFTGSATVTDKRTTGATNPVCSLVNAGTDVYEIWGTKA